MTDETALEQHGLERIVLLDSYLARSKIEMRLSGHTAITGANGEGKTSFIRLLPLFFGAEPGRIVNSRNGALQSFNNWYLPREGSYIVFEYRTDHGLNLAVFITSGEQDRTKPVLLGGAYADALFLDERDEFLPKDGLIERARAEGRPTHACPSIRDYRRIVAGSPRGLGMPERRFNILGGYPEAQRRGLSLEHANDIIRATIGNDVDERLLRRLMFEQAAQAAEVRTDGNPFGLRLRHEDIDSWQANYAGVGNLRERAGDARELLEHAEQLREAGYREALAREAAARRLGLDKDEREAAKTQHGHAKDRHEALIEEHDARKGPLERELGEKRDARIQVEQERRGYERREAEYRANDLEQTLRTANEFAVREERHRQARQNNETLSGKSADIESEIEARRVEVRTRYEEQVKPITTQLTEHDQQRDRAIRELDAKQAHERTQADERWEAQREEADAAVDAAQEAVTAARIALAQVTADPEVLAAHAEAQAQATTAEQALQEATEAYESARNELDTANTTYAETESRVETLAGREQDLATEEERLTEQLKRSGTLLEFYREHAPEALESVSAVLNAGTDLLFLDHLRPELAGEAPQGLFGVALDTSSLTAVDVDHALREQHRRTRQALVETREALAEERDALKGLDTRRKDALKAYRKASKALPLYQSRRNAAKNALDDAAECVESSRQEREKRFKTVADEAEQALTKAKEGRGTLKTRQTGERDTLRQRHEREKRERREALKAQREALETQAADLRNHRDEALGELETLRRTMLSESGVSEAVLNESAQRLRAAKEALDEAREAKAEAERWHAFVKERDEALPRLDACIATLTEEVDSLAGDLEALNERYEGLIEEQQEAMRKAGERREALDTAIRILEQALATEEAVGWDEGLDEETVRAMACLPVDRIRSELQGSSQAAERALRLVGRKLNEFLPLFYRSRSTMCLSFAEQRGLTELCAEATPVAYARAAEVIREFYGDPSQWPEGLAHFPSGSHGANVEEFVRTWAASAMELRGFVSELEAMRKSVRAQNRRIHRHYQALVARLPTIERIEVDARMNLDEVDGYQAAQAAHRALAHYNERRGEPGGAKLLPGADVVNALGELADYLRHRSNRQQINLVDALEMEFTVHQANKKVTARNGVRLKDAFSNGIGVLVAEIVLVGFLESMRQELPIAIPWMLDELLTLDEANITGLLEGLAAQRIYLVSTSPDIRNEYDRLFARWYTLVTQRENGERRGVPVMMEIAERSDEADPFSVLDEPDAMDEEVAHG